MTTATTSSEPKRSSGILLHPTSLPGQFGIGDLGPTAYRWIDMLERARQQWWQILPIHPTGYGESPYQAFSAFAGNPTWISPELLSRDSLIHLDEAPSKVFPIERVDFASVKVFKRQLLQHSWERFETQRRDADAFLAFREQEACWLEDFALFMALKEAHGGVSWQEWPKSLKLRDPTELARARREFQESIDLHVFGQFLFFRQWNDLKAYAHKHGVRLIGDVPIFVATDSADVWANPDLFLLDDSRRPTVVAGVPPDYFSATGQLWGNPLYDWEILRETGYAWWVARLRATLNQVDLVRLDHFRGFEAYWEVPADKSTAEIGRWVKGPGADFLATAQTALGGLPLIAEDLGVITPEVNALREQFSLPGMRILQFAFGGAVERRFLPHRFDCHTVVYTGTHDNDTTCGWYSTLTEAERAYLHRYLPRTNDIAWDLIRLAWSSVADLAITPLQDMLRLGNDARMNRPGTPSGNWTWRFREGDVTAHHIERLAELTETYER